MQDVTEFERFKVYVAGPPPMVEAARVQLESKGMRRSDIHADAFYAQDEQNFDSP
jgi:NAD(P)H-flavin reductase